ncbi:TetR/AcrR family transcriptional regulator [Nocardia takedensis]|uniref:TetR/AcrR family transcriptional regulator n=1 Tax=Nocardia takedensis TaxID=259390 RepID=UPI003F760AD0
MSQPLGTRGRIIQAAVRIMGAGGAAAVTNRRIAAEAGVSLGTLTYHFATQRDLVLSAMAAFVADESVKFREMADRLAAADPDLTAAGTLLDGIVSGTGFGGDHTAWFELFVQAARHPELHEATAEFFDTYDQLAQQVLRATGVTDVENSAPIAVALLVGLQLRRLATGGSTHDVVAAMTRLVQILPGGTART